MDIIPINPYSVGDNKRAKTIPTRNVTPCPKIASAALQPIPLTVLFLNDGSTIFQIKCFIQTFSDSVQ